MLDSVIDVDEQEATYYRDQPEVPQPAWDWRVDWDSLLNAALAELGLQAPTIPDWFFYRSGTPGR